MALSTFMITMLIFLGIGFISFCLLIVILAMFGKVIKIQFQIILLAKKGYHLIEHIGSDNIRRYAFMRPRENHFEFNEGFYHYIPETVTRKKEVLQKVNPELLKADIEKNVNSINRAEDEETLKFLGYLKNLKYDREAVSLSWGIPIITYYGDNPDPVLFRDRQKTYGSGVIRDMYLRLLLTLEHNRLLKLITICFIVMLGVGVVLIIFSVILSNAVKNTGVCMQMLNFTSNKCIQILNATIPHGNMTIVIPGVNG